MKIEEGKETNQNRKKKKKGKKILKRGAGPPAWNSGKRSPSCLNLHPTPVSSPYNHLSEVFKTIQGYHSPSLNLPMAPIAPMLNSKHCDTAQESLQGSVPTLLTAPSDSELHVH